MTEQRIWFKGESRSLEEQADFWEDIDKKANGVLITQTIRFIKEFFTAYTINGKIYNCHEGGLCWLHEAGHIERFKNQKLLRFYGYLVLLSTPALFFARDYPFLFNNIALLWAFTILGFELDAWIYAFKNWKR